MRSIVDLITGMRSKGHGDVVLLKVKRDGREVEIPVLLKAFDG